MKKSLKKAQTHLKLLDVLIYSPMFSNNILNNIKTNLCSIFLLLFIMIWTCVLKLWLGKLSTSRVHIGSHQLTYNVNIHWERLKKSFLMMESFILSGCWIKVVMGLWTSNYSYKYAPPKKCIFPSLARAFSAVKFSEMFSLFWND